MGDGTQPLVCLCTQGVYCSQPHVTWLRHLMIVSQHLSALPTVTFDRFWFMALCTSRSHRHGEPCVTHIDILQVHTVMKPNMFPAHMQAVLNRHVHPGAGPPARLQQHAGAGPPARLQQRLSHDVTCWVAHCAHHHKQAQSKSQSGTAQHVPPPRPSQRDTHTNDFVHLAGSVLKMGKNIWDMRTTLGGYIHPHPDGFPHNDDMLPLSHDVKLYRKHTRNFPHTQTAHHVVTRVFPHSRSRNR